MQMKLEFIIVFLAFNDDELGKAFRLVRKCDQNAIVDQFYLNISCTPQPDALNPCEDIVK